jgi:hypothetical protein
VFVYLIKLEKFQNDTNKTVYGGGYADFKPGY